MLVGLRACVPAHAPARPRTPPPAAEPRNNALLWSTLWTEDRESGVCTGMSQREWMRAAVALRETYQPDATLRAAGIAGGSATTGAAIAAALQAAFGKQPHVACSKG